MFLALTALIRDLPRLVAARVESERGATAVEYGLMVALIAVVIVGIVAALGGSLNDTFTTTNDCINDPVNCP